MMKLKTLHFATNVFIGGIFMKNNEEVLYANCNQSGAVVKKAMTIGLR